MIQSPKRRAFLKNAGLVGLVLAGGAALGGLSGCTLLPNFDVDLQIAGRDFKKYDFDEVAKRYENAPIPINSLDDFVLSGEELGWMRLAEWTEKQNIPKLGPNPLKEKSDKYSLGKVQKAPLCEEWLLAEYTGRMHYPNYRIGIIANRFKSKEDCLEAQEKLKEWHKKTNFHYKFRIFSKEDFMVIFSMGGFIDEAQRQEHLGRANLYQRRPPRDAWRKLKCSNT